MEPAGSRSAVRNIKDEATRKKVILVEKDRTKTVRQTIIAKITYSDQCPINIKGLSAMSHICLCGYEGSKHCNPVLPTAFIT